MKAISLTQPWAMLVAIGAKQIETRSWFSSYRGPLAIHAAKAYPGWAQEFFRGQVAIYFTQAQTLDLARGAIVAHAKLVACVRTLDVCVVASQLGLVPRGGWTQEFRYGNYDDGRFAFILRDVKRLQKPVPCKGKLGLWEGPDVTDLPCF